MQILQGTALLPENRGSSAFDAADLSSRGAAPRDKSFKLLDIALLQLLPIARSLAETLVFVGLGFDCESAGALRSIYGRSKIDERSAETLEMLEVLASPLPSASAGQIRQHAPLIFLSIVDDATNGARIRKIIGGLWRPAVVHFAETSSHADWASLREALIAKHYVAIGSLDGAEIFIDSPLFNSVAVTEEKSSINTFDVFDTLIARRCIDPWRIFETVGKMAAIPDFLAQRRAAEQRVLGGNYRFDDIYDELAAHYGWTAERRAELQALELDCELNAVLPIAENLARVKDGDLLVSDMYLSEEAIRKLLQRAGLKAQVGLLVESHGKSSGRVWPAIKAEFNVRRHLGDNPHADFAVAAHFGLEAELTKASDLSVVEDSFHQAGLRDLALLCREARLRTWHEDPAIRILQVLQTSVNFPLLLLTSVFLARRATALGCKTLLFSSRDCNLWLPLFQKLQPRLKTRFETPYFLTSRIARKKGSSAYMRYAREHLKPDALVVDLCGTGWTMANLAESLGLSACNVFLIDHCPPLDIFEREKKTPDTCKIHSIFKRRPNANNVVLELANMAEHGMMIDMREVRGALVPQFAPNPISALERLAITEQRQTFLSATRLLRSYDLQDVLDLDDESLSYLCTSLYEFMSRQAGAFDMFAKTFLTENAQIVETLVS